MHCVYCVSAPLWCWHYSNSSDCTVCGTVYDTRLGCCSSVYVYTPPLDCVSAHSLACSGRRHRLRIVQRKGVDGGADVIKQMLASPATLLTNCPAA